jgi:hypothetical protein
MNLEFQESDNYVTSYTSFSTIALILEYGKFLIRKYGKNSSIAPFVTKFGRNDPQLC